MVMMATMADCEEALAICAMQGIRSHEPFLANTLGIAYDATADPTGAQEQYTQALAIGREMGDLQKRLPGRW